MTDILGVVSGRELHLPGDRVCDVAGEPVRELLLDTGVGVRDPDKLVARSVRELAPLRAGDTVRELPVPGDTVRELVGEGVARISVLGTTPGDDTATRGVVVLTGSMIYCTPLLFIIRVVSPGDGVDRELGLEDGLVTILVGTFTAWVGVRVGAELTRTEDTTGLLVLAAFCFNKEATVTCEEGGVLVIHFITSWWLRLVPSIVLIVLVARDGWTGTTVVMFCDANILATCVLTIFCTSVLVVLAMR